MLYYYSYQIRKMNIWSPYQGNVLLVLMYHCRYARRYFLIKEHNTNFDAKKRYRTIKVSKGAKIRNRNNQVPHLTQDTNGKVTNSQLDCTNESREVSPFPAGDHKAQINRRAQRHNKHKTEKNIKYPQKKYRLGIVSKIFYWKERYINYNVK